MFPMTVTVNNRQQLDAVLALLAAESVSAPLQAPTQTDAPSAAPTKVSASAKTKPAKPSAEAPAPEQAATYQDAAVAITNLARIKGRDAAVAVLAKFEASKLPDVKPEQFAAVIAAATAAAQE